MKLVNWWRRGMVDCVVVIVLLIVCVVFCGLFLW